MASHSTFRRVLLIAVLGLLTQTAHAELVVVVGANSGIEQLSKRQILNIFLGHHRELPNGIPAVPVDLPANNQDKAVFYRLLVNKDLDQLAAYWSRLVFAGSTSPPYQANSVADALNFVANTRGAIAYMERRNVDSRVRVVLSLE